VRVAFYGNCQAQLLCGVYQRSVAPWSGAQAIYIDAYSPLTEESRTWLGDADLVVGQIIATGSKAAIENLPTPAKRHLFPAVAAVFLWPFGCPPHPRNQSFWHLPPGPYAIQKGDGYLNRLINQGVDPGEAVRRYLELDVTKAVDLDRLFEVSMDQQRKRDELTGHAFADEIIDNFRTERLFITPDHPNLPFARRFISALLEGLEADGDALSRVARYEQLFPIDELPIHPAVADHFRLSFLEPEQRYRFLWEGTFTFEEYADRYMRFEWNEELSEGIGLASSQQYAEALPKLEAGVARSPHSSAGFRLLASTLSAMGKVDAAIATAQRAVAEDPNDPHAHGVLFHVLRHVGRESEAETAIRAAIRIAPETAAFHLALVDLLRRQQRVHEAVSSAREAVRVEPNNSDARTNLDLLLKQLGKTEAVEERLPEPVRLAPSNAEHSLSLTQIQDARGQPQNAGRSAQRGFWPWQRH
jgi:tetratricopeptide (TPR) repeat protein